MATQSQQTNFRAHQRQAQRNSFRLTLAFTFGIVFSALAYFLITWFVVGHSSIGTWLSAVFAPEIATGNNKPYDDIKTGAIIVSSIIALVIVVIILWGFWQKRSDLADAGAVTIALSLGGQMLPAQRTLRQQQYVNVVEEMAVAAGLPCPEILYLPQDESINGFVTGGSNDQVAITVSQGALDYLTREELQALVAHEFGHIHNRDVFLNNRLTAILYGFFVIKELVSSDDDDGYDGDYDYYDNDRDDDSRSFRINIGNTYGKSYYRGSNLGLLGLGIIIISYGMIFFGKLIQAAFSRQREWLADAHAVQYTRNKDALVGVFSKAMALQSLQVNTPEVADENAHFLFINYQTKWLSTHPPMPARLSRYGQTPFQDELQALGYRLKQYKHEQQQAEAAAQAKAAQSQQFVTPGGVLLGLQPEDAPTDSTASEVATSQQRFIAEKFYPLLAIREYQKQLVQQPVASAETAAGNVLAHFVLLSNHTLSKLADKFQWDDAQQTIVQTHVDTLHQQHPSTHIQTFLHQLKPLKAYADKKALLSQITSIIKADKSFSLCEMSYLLCLRHALQKSTSESEKQSDIKSLADEVHMLLTVAATLSHEDESTQRVNYDLMKADAMPNLSAAFTPQDLDNANVQRLYKDIQALATAKKVYRSMLLAAVEKNMLLDGKLSSEQNHLLFALKAVLS